MKKLVFSLLVVFSVSQCMHIEVFPAEKFKATQYADYGAPVASYTVLGLMKSESPFWLSFPSCIGGFVVENIMTIIATGLLSGINEATSAEVIDKIAAIARITGATATAYAIAKFCESRKALNVASAI